MADTSIKTKYGTARLMYKFCEEFDFYSPTVKYLELSSINDVREYKFVKKIDWEKLKGVDVE